MELEQTPTPTPQQPPPVMAPPVMTQPQPEAAKHGSTAKKAAGPLAVIGALLLKFKVALIPLLKFFPFILKGAPTLLSMFVMVWLYAQMWGWWYALGFVLLIFVHECGHLIAARLLGLKVGMPVFIPFMGAFIALKESPRNAWVEALVGIGGPFLGTVGAAVCYVIFLLTGNPMFSGLAYVGFLLNLFNLAPVGFLDGGRIVTALSPWLWVVGISIIGVMMFVHFNFLLLLIFIFSLPRLFSLFRKKSAEEARYYEVPGPKRLIMAGMYFGLITFLVLGMMVAYVPPQR